MGGIAECFEMAGCYDLQVRGAINPNSVKDKIVRRGVILHRKQAFASSYESRPEGFEQKHGLVWKKEYDAKNIYYDLC
jgi:hypothetical protein